MESRKVFILYQHSLFARGLGTLLSQAPGLEVVGMGLGRPEEEEVWEEIKSLEPDAIVVEGDDTTPLARAPDAVPEVQLVTLSLSHSKIHIYECRDASGGGLEGVIDAIRGSDRAMGRLESVRKHGKRKGDIGETKVSSRAVIQGREV